MDKTFVSIITKRAATPRSGKQQATSRSTTSSTAVSGGGGTGCVFYDYFTVSYSDTTADIDYLTPKYDFNYLVARNYITIGSIKLEYDEENEALHAVSTKDDTLASIYADGAVSAKGLSSGGDGSTSSGSVLDGAVTSITYENSTLTITKGDGTSSTYEIVSSTSDGTVTDVSISGTNLSVTNGGVTTTTSITAYSATTATTATKLGSSTVGSGIIPIYLSSGTATPSTSTVGSSTLPMYLNAGTLTACSTSLAVSVTGYSRYLANYSSTSNNGGLQYYHGQVTKDGTDTGGVWGNSSDSNPGYTNAMNLRMWWNSSFYVDILTSPNVWSSTSGGLYIRQITDLGLTAGTYTGGWRQVLDSCNFNRYAPTLDGTGASGSWDINAATATKLATARTLWGQSFDGSANVSGALTSVTSITMTGNLTMANATYIRAYDSAGTVRNLMYLNSSNALVIGYGTAAASYSTYLDGYAVYFRYGSSHTTGMILNSSGNVGIGTTSPSYKLHVSGNVYSSGNILAAGAVTAKSTSSDQRLKTDISDYDALTLIKAIKAIKFKWNDTAKANSDIFCTDADQYGFIAQQLQEIGLGQYVSDPFGDYLTVDYERFVPIAIKGIQELAEENKKLTENVKRLSDRVKDLEDKLNEILARL